MNKKSKCINKWQNYFERTGKRPKLYLALESFIEDCYLYMNRKINGDVVRENLYTRYMTFIDMGYFKNKDELTESQLKETKIIIRYILDSELASNYSFIDLNLYSHYMVIKTFFDKLISLSQEENIITYAYSEQFFEVLNQARSDLSEFRVDPFEESTKQKKSKKIRRYKYDSSKNNSIRK